LVEREGNGDCKAYIIKIRKSIQMVNQDSLTFSGIGIRNRNFKQ
jgi:hypothetical protein